MPTFDEAQAAFRSAPSRKTARVYAAVAREYWTDEMIGTTTLDAVGAELDKRGYGAAFVFGMTAAAT